MTLGAVLLTGLLAGGVSCAVVQGGLLAGVLARRHPENLATGRPRRSQTTRSKQTNRKPADLPARRDDAAPVSGFLLGQLASHVMLGAALGLVGNAAQVSPSVRANMQIGAGIVMVLLALDLLGVKAIRRRVPSPPATWARLVRRSGRWGGGFAPAFLGFATVLIPCGITLSMMFLVVASGSPITGAAIMGAFVVGTMPLFAVIGYAARRSAVAMRGRLATLGGVAVLGAGLLAINAGQGNGSSFSLADVLPIEKG